MISTTTPKPGEKKFQNLGLPPGTEPHEGFVIRTWLWSPKDRDYTIENLDETGRKFFEDFSSAREYFDGMVSSEMKVDLIQYKYGLGHIIKSRILLPKTRH